MATGATVRPEHISPALFLVFSDDTRLNSLFSSFDYFFQLTPSQIISFILTLSLIPFPLLSYITGGFQTQMLTGTNQKIFSLNEEDLVG